MVQGAEWTCPPMDAWDFGSDGDPAADDDLVLESTAAPCNAPRRAQEGAAAAAAGTATAAAAPQPPPQRQPTDHQPQQPPQRQPGPQRQQQAGRAEAAGSSRKVCTQPPAGWLPAHRMVVPRSAVFYCASFCALPGLPHTRATSYTPCSSRTVLHKHRSTRSKGVVDHDTLLAAAAGRPENEKAAWCLCTCRCADAGAIAAQRRAGPLRGDL
jgi:hypothetical protein